MLSICVIVIRICALSPGHPVGEDDRHVWGTIRGVQLILASHVPLQWAIGCRDHWLHCVCESSGDTIGCGDSL